MRELIEFPTDAAHHASIGTTSNASTGSAFLTFLGKLARRLFPIRPLTIIGPSPGTWLSHLAFASLATLLTFTHARIAIALFIDDIAIDVKPLQGTMHIPTIGPLGIEHRDQRIAGAKRIECLGQLKFQLIIKLI